ncbi:hypothetical protein GCM10009660_06310 [Catellatospora bangladeshensis]
MGGRGAATRNTRATAPGHSAQGSGISLSEPDIRALPPTAMATSASASPTAVTTRTSPAAMVAAWPTPTSSVVSQTLHALEAELAAKLGDPPSAGR